MIVVPRALLSQWQYVPCKQPGKDKLQQLWHRARLVVAALFVSDIISLLFAKISMLTADGGAAFELDRVKMEASHDTANYYVSAQFVFCPCTRIHIQGCNWLHRRVCLSVVDAPVVIQW